MINAKNKTAREALAKTLLTPGTSDGLDGGTKYVHRYVQTITFSTKFGNPFQLFTFQKKIGKFGKNFPQIPFWKAFRIGFPDKIKNPI